MMKRILASVAIGTFPLLAFAQAIGVQKGYYSGSYGLRGIIIWAHDVLGLLLPLIVAMAVVWFVWSVFQYTMAGGDEAKVTKEKTQIIWGIVGIFIMVSVWGLVGILRGTFDLNNTMIPAPTIDMP
ncbi:MAG: hypothetical protein C0412_20170 [Flavobacterium sp.]|nr:hypothetical protein [Flavobacterium sp.]